MAVEEYVNPYDQQISVEELAAEKKALESDRSLFENQDMVKIIKAYLEENVPENVRESELFKEFWAVIGKKIQLTFLDPEDLFEFEAMFLQCKSLILMREPAYALTFERIQLIKQVEMYFKAALRSAVGGKTGRLNERMILGSTITQTVRSNTEQYGSVGGGKKGFLGLGRLF